MKLAVFGGAGFIGSHFVDKAIKSRRFHEILVVDKLTYAGSLLNLNSAMTNENVKFIEADILNNNAYSEFILNFDAVVNFAAESHVDRSIESPLIFAQTNALGPCVLVNTCMEKQVKRFIQISTDEVYGPIISGESVEESSLNPTSPYSASKEAGESMVMAYWRTYGYPVIVTRGCNTYGPRQYPEKLIPLAINNFKNTKEVPLYGSGEQIREWIHVEDHATAILEILVRGKPGEIYNIGTGMRIANKALLELIAKALHADPNLIKPVQDRLGHDFRYALDSTKIVRELGWKHTHILENSIQECSGW
jgi:dTDP-glucose 4,6-dehydratase